MKALLLGEVLALLVTARDEVLPQSLQDKLHLTALPSLSSWQWATVAMLLFVLFVFEGAYQFGKSLGLEEQFQRSRNPRERRPGFLDSIVTGKRAAGQIRSHAMYLSKRLARFGAKMIVLSEEYGKASDIEGQIRVAKKVKRCVDAYRSDLERKREGLWKAVTTWENNYMVYVGKLSVGATKDKIRQGVHETRDLSEQTRDSWVGHLESVMAVSNENVYGPLTRSTHRLELAQVQILACFSKTQDAADSMLKIMDSSAPTPAPPSTPSTAGSQPQ